MKLPPQQKDEPEWLKVQRQRKQEAEIGAKGGFPAIGAMGCIVLIASQYPLRVQVAILLFSTLVSAYFWRKSPRGSARSVFGRDLSAMCSIAFVAGLGAILTS